MKTFTSFIVAKVQGEELIYHSAYCRPLKGRMTLQDDLKHLIVPMFQGDARTLTPISMHATSLVKDNDIFTD